MLSNRMGMPDIFLATGRNGVFAKQDEASGFYCITDRTQEDVDRLKELRRKLLSGQYTEQDWEEYHYYSKGALNYSDLARIEGNLETLASLLRVNLYSMERDPIPRVPYFTNLLKNITIIRESPYCSDITPQVPSMPLNTYQKINDIEKILLDAYTVFTANAASEYYAGSELVMPRNTII